VPEFPSSPSCLIAGVSVRERIDLVLGFFFSSENVSSAVFEKILYNWCIREITKLTLLLRFILIAIVWSLQRPAQFYIDSKQSDAGGSLNCDPRRAAGDTVIVFSCDGRVDGGGSVTNSQIFSFAAGETSLMLQPENGDGSVCLVPNASGMLDQAACSDDACHVFTLG
jgi:hypothetical protein